MSTQLEDNLRLILDQKVTSLNLVTDIWNDDYSLPQEGLLYNNSELLTFSNNVVNTGIAQSSLSNGYTIAIRYYPTQYANYKGLYGLHSANPSGLTGLQWENGKIYFGNSGVASVNFDASLAPINKWHTFIVTYDKNTLNGYLNGTNVGSVVCKSFKPYGNVQFGRSYYTGNDRSFTGKVSDILIYNRALSEEELVNVRDHFNMDTTDTLNLQLKHIANEKIVKVIPENIKSGVSIFDIVGTLDVGAGSITEEEYVEANNLADTILGDIPLSDVALDVSANDTISIENNTLIIGGNM